MYSSHLHFLDLHRYIQLHTYLWHESRVKPSMGTKGTGGHELGEKRHVGDMLNVQYVYVVNLKKS